MNGSQGASDLLVLAADKDMEHTFTGILARYQSLGIRQVTAKIISHPEKDPGCLLRSHEFTRYFVDQYRYVLVAFDLDGCGRTGVCRQELESEVENRLENNGWKNRARVIVIEPELEAWVWSNSPEIDAIIGWQGRQPDLRQWLLTQNFLSPSAVKPDRPKEAMQRALGVAKKPRSSSLYLQLAERVGLNRCVDPSFVKLKTVLQEWFGV